MAKSNKTTSSKKADEKSSPAKSNAASKTPGEFSVVEMIETIDENTPFDSMISNPKNDLRVICRRISRINSAGIRSWKGCFDHLAKIGVKLTFWECPPVILQQTVLFENFLSGGDIESVLVPFLCPVCGKSFEKLVVRKDLKKIKDQLGGTRCENCGSKAEFDDDPDVYLRLLK